MTDLIRSSCVPCRGGVPTLTDEEIATFMPQVSGWKVADVDGVKRLTKEFTFPDFAEAMAFAVEVGMLADMEQHHPDLHVAWGKVGVEIWTHKIRGLHQNDFILAAKIDALGSRA
jgi:4a-hydroxytetrahydrobiopterin dehydratase